MTCTGKVSKVLQLIQNLQLAPGLDNEIDGVVGGLVGGFLGVLIMCQKISQKTNEMLIRRQEKATS